MKQKYLVISLVLLLLQLGIYYFEIFSNVQFSQTITDTWFFITGALTIILSIVSIKKKESGAAGAIIGFEVFIMLLLMMGHGG